MRHHQNLLIIFTSVFFLFGLSDNSKGQKGTWSSQSSGTQENFRNVNFVNDTIGWAVGTNGTILHTSDSGNTWIEQTTSTNENLNGVSFRNETTGFAVGVHSTIVYTSDQGINWNSQKKNGNYSLVNVSFVNNKGWAVGGNTTEAVIFYTSDEGSNWSQQNSNTNEKLYSVYFTDENTGWAVGNNGTIVHTDDGGTNWNIQNSGTNQNLRGVSFANDTNGWAVGANGTILHTSDGGNTWTSQNSATNAKLRGVSFPNDSTGWVAGDNGTILSTSNQGNDWSQQNSNTSRTLSDVHFPNKAYGWAVGRNGTIVKYQMNFPEKVVLDHPNNNADQIALKPGLFWNQTELASSFQVQISKDFGFDDIILDTPGIEKTEYDLTTKLNHNETYFWRVRGINVAGSGEWSEIRSFTTEEIDPPEQINLKKPSNNAKRVKLQPLFTWEKGSRVDSYRLEVGTNTALTSPQITQTLKDTTYQVEMDLSSGETYYWRVRGKNDGGEGNWSPIWSFTTEEKTSISDKKSSQNFDLNVHPNPVKNQLTLNPSTPRTYYYTIYSASGLQMKAGEIQNKDNQTLNVSGFSSGVYFLKVRVKDAVQIEKLIIR